MEFKLFSQIIDIIKLVQNAYSSNLSDVAATITPAVWAGLNLSFIIYAWLIIRGVIDMPITDFLGRCLRIGVISSIATATGLYQKEIIDIISLAPEKIVVSLSGGGGGHTASGPIIILLDKVAGKGFDCATMAFEEAAFLSSDGMLYGIFGILILLATGIFVAVSGVFLTMAIFTLSVILFLGPIFIIALLWKSTYRFFERWATQVLFYTFFLTLLYIVLPLPLRIFYNYMSDLKFDGTYNVGYTLGGAIILSIGSIMLLFKLSSLANAFAKGITVGHLLGGQTIIRRVIVPTTK